MDVLSVFGSVGGCFYMYGYIYKFTLVPTGDFYVGLHKYENQTELDENYWGSGNKWKELISQYDESTWPQIIKREILEWCETYEELENREIYWIDKLNARVDGMNVAVGGQNLWKWLKVWREEYPEEFSKAQSKASKGQIGKPKTAECRKHISEAHTEYWLNNDKTCTKEHRENVSKSLMGHEITDDVKNKIAKSVSGFICMTNGNTNIHAYPHEIDMILNMGLGYHEGTTKGIKCKGSKDYICIYDVEDHYRWVYKDELEQWLLHGWFDNRLDRRRYLANAQGK